MAGRKFLQDCGKYVQNNIKSMWKGFKGENILMDDVKVLYDFVEPETINNFDLITDQDVGGKSVATMSTSDNGRLLFKGKLSTELDQGSNVDHSGFCGIRSKPVIGLFDKIETVDMTYYDAVDIKYRGDGRCYFLNMQTESMMLLNQYDLFQAFLFTKGGPYWEVERVPFTKFLMTYQGYLQDEQVDFSNIRTLGVSISDKKSGPFGLEIEYIKLVKVGHQPIIFKHQKYNRFENY